ncbi:MAG: alpha/beta fold hydrolase, partial [Phycisphaerae bacterium]|nr:alpha/beta fold hydrolase [Phycisphaerae bacterium]
MNFKDANSLDAPADRGGLGVSAEGLARGVRLWPVDPADASPDAVLARVIDVAEAPTDGPPVVFLHGLVGLNDHWEGVVQRVRDGLRCTLFELPLLRLTGRHCSIEGVTDLTRRFLVEQVGRPALLVGNSFGGHVALRLAIDSPELVRGLVLAGSGGLVERTLVS